MASVAGYFNIQEFSDAGALLAGGRIYTYTYGTTTHKTAYTDAAGAVPHTYTNDGLGGQYIALDARGELPAPLYLATGSYDIALKRADGSTVWTRRADPTYDTAAALDAALRADLVSTASTAVGDALVGVKRTATNASATTLHAWIEGTVLDAGRDFLVVADGVTDQRTKLATAIACATTLAPCTLVLPRGVIYCATSLGNLAVNGLTIRGQGDSVRETTLKFGHAGVALLVDAFASGSPSDPFVQVSLLNFTVEGNEDTTSIFKAQGVHRSCWRIAAKEGEPLAGIAFDILGCMSNTMELTCSNDLVSMTSKPYEGLRLSAGTRAGSSVGNSSNNVIINPQIDGLSIGVRLAGADQNVVLTGASQSHSVYGLLVASGSRYNTFIGTGFENPSASSAAVADAGEDTLFERCYCDQKLLLQGRACNIRGGFYERIEVQAGAADNVVDGVRLNNWRTGNGGFFDSGTNTKPTRLYGTTFTASFATSVMTVTAATQVVFAVGQEVVATGVPAGTTITSFGTGTGGAGTYNLSTTPGTLTSRACSTLAKVEYLSDRTAIVVGASPFTWTNDTGRYVEVAIQTGTVSQIRGLRGTDSWLRPTAIPGIHLVAPGDKLEVSYSVLPGMSYVPHNSFQG